LFDAFHDHLTLIDGECSSSQSIICDTPYSQASLSQPTDSGYLSASEELSVHNEGLSISVNETPVSNAALRNMLQAQWISFISGEVSDVEDLKIGQAPITLYGKDRRIYVTSMTSDLEWLKQAERLKLLAADWKGATAALKEITGVARR
jgi:hypothetical protein